MKKFISIIAGLTLTCACFGSAYKVKVETFVGGKLEDKFTFVIKEGKPQEKGYDGKYLAKRYLAKGFGNTALDFADEAKKAKLYREKQAEKTFLQRTEDMLMALRGEVAYNEKTVASSTERNSKLKERIELLEEIEKLGNTQTAKKKYEEYMETYGPSKQDIIDSKKREFLQKIKYRDYEEYDLGSFCRMEILKVLNPRVVRFNISYGYSRVLSMAYHDGLNTDNSITKYPILEIFERLNAKAKITLGKPYCIQFARPKSTDEAKTIQDAIAQTRLFSGAEIAESDEEAEDAPEKKKSPLDVKGSYDKIKEAFATEAGQTVRAVFTVTAVK